MQNMSEENKTKFENSEERLKRFDKNINLDKQNDPQNYRVTLNPVREQVFDFDPFDNEESKLFENCSNEAPDQENKRIQSIIKLVNARDPPNKIFESTVNLANKDAWKRRSIYLTKAQLQFDTQLCNNIRHSINIGFRSTALVKEDSIEDSSWNNTDEGIGEMDRFIPSIGIPKCLTALKDKYLPPGLQKMLRQSTRFSLSFHMPSQESKFGKRESQLRESIDCKYNSKRSEREVSKRITEESVAKSKEMSVQSNDIFKRIESTDRDDNCNIADDDSTNEVSIADRCDNLNKLNINAMVSICNFNK